MLKSLVTFVEPIFDREIFTHIIAEVTSSIARVEEFSSKEMTLFGIGYQCQ